MSKFRIRVWDLADETDRGRGDLAAIIFDAKDIGASEHANDAGELFFTLPWNHPYASEIDPLRQHYEVSRWNGSSYSTMFQGLIDDFEADANEIVVYGTDYLGQLGINIVTSSTSYTSQTVSAILTDQMTSIPDTVNGVLGFITVGTIDATSKTTTIIAPHMVHLDLLRGLLEFEQADGSTLPLIQFNRAYPPTLTFDSNAGSNQDDILLKYGGLVDDFRFAPGFADLYTNVHSIGQRREGASILYSIQTYASRATYGYRAAAELFIDVINQGNLDDRTKRSARRRGTPNNSVAIAIRSGQLIPWDGYDLMDSVPVVIDRGAAQLDGYYTIWGLEWIGRKNGSEELFLNLLPKLT